MDEEKKKEKSGKKGKQESNTPREKERERTRCGAQKRREGEEAGHYAIRKWLTTYTRTQLTNVNQTDPRPCVRSRQYSLDSLSLSLSFCPCRQNTHGFFFGINKEKESDVSDALREKEKTRECVYTRAYIRGERERRGATV